MRGLSRHQPQRHRRLYTSACRDPLMQVRINTNRPAATHQRNFAELQRPPEPRRNPRVRCRWHAMYRHACRQPYRDAVPCTSRKLVQHRFKKTQHVYTHGLDMPVGDGPNTMVSKSCLALLRPTKANSPVTAPAETKREFRVRVARGMLQVIRDEDHLPK